MRQNPRQWTDAHIRALPHPEAGSRKFFDPSLPGFGIRLTTKAKTFIVQFGPKRTVRTIGKYPSMSLRLARREALGFLDDPTPEKRSTPREQLREAFLTHCDATLRPTTAKRYRLSFKKIEPETPHDIVAFKAMYNWGMRNGLVDKNPYHHLQAKFQSRDRVLTDSEIAAIWNHDRPPFSDILKLLILTGQRRNQISSFDPAWIHGNEIHFPPSVMKSKRPHIIPATDNTLKVLPGLTPFNGWSKSKRRLDAESGVEDWVLHDIRRYFSSTMARLGTPLHVTEHILDHRSTVSGVAAVYNRYGFLPEMRGALEKYEQHVHSVTSQASV